MSEIVNNIGKMTIKEILAKYTKEDVLEEFLKVQKNMGFDPNKIREANILFQLVQSYDALSQQYAE